MLDEFSLDANVLMVVTLAGYSRLCRRLPDLLWSLWTPHDRMFHHLAEEPLISYLVPLFLHIRNPKLTISAATFGLKYHFYLSISSGML